MHIPSQSGHPFRGKAEIRRGHRNKEGSGLHISLTQLIVLSRGENLWGLSLKRGKKHYIPESREMPAVEIHVLHIFIAGGG